MHTYTSHFGFLFPLDRERRLCFQVSPSEALNAPRQMRENPTLNSVMTLYENPLLIGNYPELSRSESAYFQSLVIAGASNGPISATLTNRDRAAFRPTDVGHLATRPGATPESIGTQLLEIYRDNPNGLAELFGSGAVLPVNDRERAIGQQYMDAQLRADASWRR